MAPAATTFVNFCCQRKCILFVWRTSIFLWDFFMMRCMMIYPSLQELDLVPTTLVAAGLNLLAAVSEVDNSEEFELVLLPLLAEETTPLPPPPPLQSDLLRNTETLDRLFPVTSLWSFLALGIVTFSSWSSEEAEWSGRARVTLCWLWLVCNLLSKSVDGGLKTSSMVLFFALGRDSSTLFSAPKCGVFSGLSHTIALQLRLAGTTWAQIKTRLVVKIVRKFP